MKIDKTNYELFFIDYFDGNLSDADIAMLFDFLEQNADLKIEFSKYEEINISDNSTVSFDVKNELKQIDKNSKFSVDLFDAFAVGFIENELTENQKIEFIAEVEKNENFKSELNLYKSTIIEADNEIVFENKKSLKHSTINIYYKPIQYSIAVAACLLLFYSLFQINDKNEKIQAYVPREKSEVLVAENFVESEPIFKNDIVQKSQNVLVKQNIVKGKSVEKNINFQEQVLEENLVSVIEPKIEVIEPINIVKEEIAENSENQNQQKTEAKISVKSKSKNKENTRFTLKQFALNFIKEKILKVETDKNENITLWKFGCYTKQRNF